MKYVNLRELRVSNICFGTAGFGGGAIDEPTAFALLDLWRELGGNFADTANVYGRWTDGTNLGELIIGRYLASRGKSSLIVGTKGCHWSPDEPDRSRVREDCARRDIEESLRSLGIEAIPIYWLHRDDESRPIEEILGFCEKLRAEGKLLYYGFSNYSAYRLREAAECCRERGWSGFIGVQNRHFAPVYTEAAAAKQDKTLREYTPEEGEFHRSSGVAEMPYSSLAQGCFAKMSEAGVCVSGGRIVGEYDRKAISPEFEAKWFSPRTLSRYELLKAYADGAGLDMYQASVAFHTCRDYLDIPIAATSGAARLRALAAASKARIPAELINKIEAI